jgi:hypothetical protein
MDSESYGPKRFMKNTEGQYGFGQFMDSLLTFDEMDARAKREARR